MNDFTKVSNNSLAVFFPGVLAVFSILLGLFLILVQDNETRVRWLSDASAVYLLQARKQDSAVDVVNQNFLHQTRKSLTEAVLIKPHDSDLWIQLAYLLALENGDASKANRALDIAGILQPDLSADINIHRRALSRIFRSGTTMP